MSLLVREVLWKTMNLNDFLQKKKRPYTSVPSERARKTAKLVAKGKSVSRAMVESGYSPASAKNPQLLTTSQQWKKILEEELSDKLLGNVHKDLINAHTLAHMIFPLGPKGEDDLNLSGAQPNNDVTHEEDKELKAERTTLTDQEIKEMLLEVGCKVKRIVHGEQARHVYFWSPDNAARQSALNLAYKLKGHFAPEKHLVAVAEVDPEKRNKIRQILGISDE